MVKPIGMTMVALGGGYLMWAAFVGCAGPADVVEAPAPLEVAVPPAAPPVQVDDVCSANSGWKRRVYVNVNYEAAQPAWAVAIAQRELAHREGEVTYVNAGTDQQASSLNGKLPVGQDLTWLSELEVGRVTNISNSDSPVQPELDQLCSRLQALERGEGMMMQALVGQGDREAAAVMLELARNEVNNLRNRIDSLEREAEYAQINLYFNPVQPR